MGVSRTRSAPYFCRRPRVICSTDKDCHTLFLSSPTCKNDMPRTMQVMKGPRSLSTQEWLQAK